MYPNKLLTKAEINAMAACFPTTDGRNEFDRFYLRRYNEAWEALNELPFYTTAEDKNVIATQKAA